MKVTESSPGMDHGRPVARSGLGGAFFKKVDIFECFLRESGFFCVFFWKKWTFLHAFGEKVYLFACIFG